jgi:glycine cleavage system H lipoate-binding protein
LESLKTNSNISSEVNKEWKRNYKLRKQPEIINKRK